MPSGTGWPASCPPPRRPPAIRAVPYDRSVAIFSGHAVHRYTPDGKLDAVVELPASRVTACTFGGEHLDELYITTSRENLAPDAEPEAGAVFRAIPGVRGLPLGTFAG